MNKKKNMMAAMKKAVFFGWAAALLLSIQPAMIHGEELQLDADKLRDFLKGKIIEKVDEVFINAATGAEGAVRDATYFNEILRDYEALGLHETNFAQTAFELYRGYLEALEKDKEESDPEKKTNAQDFLDDKVNATINTVVMAMLDEPSREIVDSLRGLYADGAARMKEIAEAGKAAADPELPEAEYAKILQKAGITGALIDDLEEIEVAYHGLKNMTADYVEAYNALETVVGALKSRDPGSKIETLFSLGAQYGGKIPVLGMFVQKYFEVAQEMIKACKGLGEKIREREGNCVGGTTTGQIDTSLGGDPRNIQWMKQFPDREACPEGKKGIYLNIYKDVKDGGSIFFWVDGRYVAGLPHGGIPDLQALIQWLRRNDHKSEAEDVAFLAKAYNIPPGFIRRQKEVEEKAQELQREVRRLAEQLLCASDATEKFLLQDMRLQAIIEALEMDEGLVRSFPFVDEIVDKVIEERIMNGNASFHQLVLNALSRVKRTMAFHVQGRVTDARGGGIAGARIDVSPGENVLDDCTDEQADDKGYFRVTLIKSPGDTLDVRVKATNDDNESEEKTIQASGTTDEYPCDISFAKGSDVVSLIIQPAEKTLTVGDSVSFSVFGVNKDGETEKIPTGLVKWGNAADGVFAAKEAGTFKVTAEYLKISASATVIVEEATEEEKPEEPGDLDEALDELQEDAEGDPCEEELAALIERFNSLKQMVEQKYVQFNGAAAKFYSEINARRADPCSNRMVAFAYYQAKAIGAEFSGISAELQDLYSQIVISSVLCSKKDVKATIKGLIGDVSAMGPRFGDVERTLAAMQGRLGELACDEQEVERNGQQVTAQGDIDPNLLQQGGAMVEVQGDSVDNTGEGLQDERNFQSALLIMVWDSGSAKDDIFAVSMSGVGFLGATPKGGRQVFAPERVQPGMSYTVSITTLKTEVGAGTWSVMVSYKGRVLVSATAGADSGSVSFTIPAL
jgi:hypothetical protein